MYSKFIKCNDEAFLSQRLPPSDTFFFVRCFSQLTPRKAEQSIKALNYKKNKKVKMKSN